MPALLLQLQSLKVTRNRHLVVEHCTSPSVLKNKTLKLAYPIIVEGLRYLYHGMDRFRGRSEVMVTGPVHTSLYIMLDHLQMDT